MELGPGGSPAICTLRYHRAIASDQQPPRHEEAALLLVEGKPRPLVAPNAGYNFGLVGVAHDLTAKAGQSLPLALLPIGIGRHGSGAKVRLATALEAMKALVLRATANPE